MTPETKARRERPAHKVKLARRGRRVKKAILVTQAHKGRRETRESRDRRERRVRRGLPDPKGTLARGWTYSVSTTALKSSRRP